MPDRKIEEALRAECQKLYTPQTQMGLQNYGKICYHSVLVMRFSGVKGTKYTFPRFPILFLA